MLETQHEDAQIPAISKLNHVFFTMTAFIHHAEIFSF